VRSFSGIRFISEPKVLLKKWRFEIIPRPASTHANPGTVALNKHPSDGV
jgi:hypothetical protein